MSFLGVGGDDSNHAGTSKGEIIVATFSEYKEDTIVRNFPNRRDLQKVMGWLEMPGVDYRFAILQTEQYRHSNKNLVDIVPQIVLSYLKERDLGLEKLNIYLDGKLNPGGRDSVKETISKEFNIDEIVVDNFTKRKGKAQKCPHLVYCADVLSNYLYSQKSFEELSRDPRLVLIR